MGRTMRQRNRGPSLRGEAPLHCSWLPPMIPLLIFFIFRLYLVVLRDLSSSVLKGGDWGCNLAQALPGMNPFLRGKFLLGGHLIICLLGPSCPGGWVSP